MENGLDEMTQIDCKFEFRNPKFETISPFRTSIFGFRILFVAPVRFRIEVHRRIDRRTAVPYNPSWLSGSSAIKASDAFTKMTT
jgi:hypothetical protein